MSIKRTLMAVAILLGLAFPSGAAADGDAREQQLKAAFIYNFIQFTEWPGGAFPDPSAPVVLGVVAEPSMAATLEATLKGKRVNGHDLLVRRFAPGQPIDGCHVLYVGPAQREHLPELLARGGRALVIGEGDRFTSQGGVIRFLTEDNKLRFEINLAAAEQRQLKFSAKLLKLARIYQG